MSSQKTHKLTDFGPERPDSLQRRLTVPSPIPASDPKSCDAEFGSFSASKRQDHGLHQLLASHIVALVALPTAAEKAKRLPRRTKTPRTGQGGPFRVMVLPTPLHPLSRNHASFPLDNALIIVVDAAGDHHTRLNPTLAPIASSHRLRLKG
jgi:hypothetical protein